MGRFERANVILGAITVAVALGIAFVWVPADSATGLIETVRRQVAIGDALAPTLATAFLLIGGLMVMLLERPGNARHLTGRNLLFLCVLCGIIVVSFLIMRWTGPAVAVLLTDEGYRPLRDTAPWKYIGFVTGGTALIAGLIALVEGRVTWRGVVCGVGAAIALIVVYDLPFDDLLLPPNGDV